MLREKVAKNWTPCMCISESARVKMYQYLGFCTPDSLGSLSMLL